MKTTTKKSRTTKPKKSTTVPKHRKAKHRNSGAMTERAVVRALADAATSCASVTAAAQEAADQSRRQYDPELIALATRVRDARKTLPKPTSLERKKAELVGLLKTIEGSRYLGDKQRHLYEAESIVVAFYDFHLLPDEFDPDGRS